MMNYPVPKITLRAVVLLLPLLALSACSESTPSSCEETFKWGMEGAWSTAITENKQRCASDYKKWLAATPPTEFSLVGRSIQIGKSVYSVDGMVIRREPMYLQGITDDPIPSIFVSQGRHNTVLRFQSDAQADAAFAEISAAIAGTPAKADLAASSPKK